jgi:hypothetical protein
MSRSLLALLTAFLLTLLTAQIAPSVPNYKRAKFYLTRH